MVGWLAPVLLCVLRLGQGIGLGGEWSGAALLAVENAPQGWHGRFGSVPQLGAPIGFIVANGFFLLLGLWLTPAQFAAWGWRIPFLASISLVALGLWVRLKLGETPAFKAVMESGGPAQAPLSEVLGGHFVRTLAGTLGVVACFAVYYVATAFALGYGITQLGYPRQTLLGAQLVAILFMAVGIGLAGWASDRFRPGTVLLGGCAATVVAGLALAPLFGSGAPALAFIFLAFALLTMGFVYGPLGAWLTGLYPARVRYTATSIAFNVGGSIGGGLTPVIAQLLADRGGLKLVGLYLIGAAVLSAGGILAAGRTDRQAEL
jgi:MFS family permease